jgi:hypothetical protein
MRGAIPPLPQYASMVRCSIKAQEQLYFYLYLYIYGHFIEYVKATLGKVLDDFQPCAAVK